MFFTYISTNRKNGTLYTGHTEDIAVRMDQHKQGLFAGFSKDHDCSRLMWFEWHETRDAAFKRERQIKEWDREWKIKLIEELNLHWDDLALNLTHEVVFDMRRKFKPKK